MVFFYHLAVIIRHLQLQWIPIFIRQTHVLQSHQIPRSFNYSIPWMRVAVWSRTLSVRCFVHAFRWLGRGMTSWIWFGAGLFGPLWGFCSICGFYWSLLSLWRGVTGAEVMCCWIWNMFADRTAQGVFCDWDLTVQSAKIHLIEFSVFYLQSLSLYFLLLLPFSFQYHIDCQRFNSKGRESW